ncbi:MAG: ATP synthase F0 subunit A [Acidobacteria bacterium]|nr:MAG: ATP synthase F0 subunit A [Acidobacteriota bacterium]
MALRGRSRRTRLPRGGPGDGVGRPQHAGGLRPGAVVARAADRGVLPRHPRRDARPHGGAPVGGAGGAARRRPAGRSAGGLPPRPLHGLPGPRDGDRVAAGPPAGAAVRTPLWLLAAVEGAAPQAPAKGETNPAEVLLHHVTDRALFRHLDWGRLHFEPTKHLVFFVIAAGVVLLLARLARRSYREGGVPTGLGAVVETLVLFIRDEIAEKNIGHDGRVFTPLLCSFFFFILIAALLGLMPFPVYDPSTGHFGLVSATSTGNIAVTLGLAFVSFLAMQYAGIRKYGVIGHFRGIVPPGLPVWLLPIMIPVEILGMFTKPFALMVRLFANMLAGHMVITVLLMLIPLMAAIRAAFGVAVIPVSLALALFIMLLELLVALIQAYIFTLLTAIFIGMFAHPAP